MSEFEDTGLALPEESLPQLPAEVTEYLAHLDQRSANEALRQFGEEFGVKTAEVNGVRYLLASALAQSIYGRGDTSDLASLLKTRSEPFKLLDRVRVDSGFDLQFRDALSAAPYGNSPAVATWSHVLIAGTYGRTDAAEKIRDYIKRAELYARRQAMAITETGYSIEQLTTGMHQHMAEMKTLLMESVAAAVSASMDLIIKALPAMVDQAVDRKLTDAVQAEVQRQMAVFTPPPIPAELPMMVTAGGFWRAREHEGFVSEARYVGIALAQRLRGQGQKGRYPVPALERAFKAMVAEGKIHRPSRRAR